MRSIWSGSLSFGLVNIPVRLYSATQEHEISFDLLHKKDFSPIRYAKICKKEEKEVDYKDIVKGYEYEKGQYIILTDEDFEKVNQKKNKLIEIKFFTYETEIDSVYFDKPYFLEPDKGASKAYEILREALKHSEKVGVAVFVFRNREHIALVKPYGQAIILNVLRYESEIRDASSLNLPSATKNTTKEIETAIKLIDQLTESFKPKDFKSHYTEELKEVIDEKIHGKGPHPKVTDQPKVTKVQDIMSTLKASLKELKPRPSARPSTSRRIRPKKTRAPK